MPNVSREALEVLAGLLCRVADDFAAAVWLSWVDVDLDAGSATVRSGSQDDWDGPKSEASERSVALDSATVAVLRAHSRTQQESRLRAGPG
jgi:hypothetical protein